MAITKQDWLDAMGVPVDRAFTLDLDSCPDPDLPCACAECRSYLDGEVSNGD